MKLAATWLIACFGITALFGQDVLKVARPGTVKVEYEDSQMRVLRFKEPPGTKLPLHSHPAYAAVSLSNDTAQYTLADGTKSDQTTKVGEVSFANPTTHASRNTGTSAGESIMVELKTAPAGVVLTGEGDMVQTNPETCKVEVDNEYLRISRVTVPAHGTVAMHSHPSANVVVYVSGGHLKTTAADGHVTDTVVAPGTVRVNPPGKHSNENVGDKPTEAVVIELKTATK